MHGPTEKKAIIIEKNEGHRETLRVLLESRGFEVLAFSNASPALRGSSDGADLLIVDLSPGHDLDGARGEELCRRLQPASIVAISTASDPIPSWLVAAGCSAVLTKPLDVDTFIRAISAKASGEGGHP